MTPASRKFRIARTIIFAIAGISVLAVLAIIVAIRIGFNTEGEEMGAVQKTAISSDGTVIAYEQTGSGPVVILVSAALADRTGNRRLARALSNRFTVINYDRRGRGASGNTQPYAIEREVEDVSRWSKQTEAQPISLEAPPAPCWRWDAQLISAQKSRSSTDVR